MGNIMRSICYLLLISAMPLLKVEASLAQELSVEDRACITGAVAKLPQVAALKIEGSRAIEGRVLEQPQSQGLRKWNVYRVKVEIDVSVAGQESTYVFNCIHSGQATVIQPLGMRPAPSARESRVRYTARRLQSRSARHPPAQMADSVALG
jgi:hypothetical protein